MPLAQPISSLRNELQELVINDLPAALTMCKELLPENTEKFNLVLAMQANLKQLSKDRFKSLITQEEYGRRIANITDSFIEFIADLQEADFNPPLASSLASGKTSTAQLGSVLYQVPHHMPLGKPSFCKIRVAIEEDAILEDIVINDDVRIRERIEVSDRMSAELVDTEGKVFDIQSLNSKDQNVRLTGYTQWLFRVTPLVEGEHHLLVKVSLLEFDKNTREYIPRDVSVLETVTVVTATHRGDDDETPLKSTGSSFVMGPSDQEGTVENTSIGSGGRPIFNNASIRTTAFFLAFLIFASTTTWAFAKPLERDFLIMNLLNSRAASEQFIKNHRKDAPGGVQHPLIEKAYFKKAKQSGTLADLREYQEVYQEKGTFEEEVIDRIATLEWKEVVSIQKRPDLISIQSFLKKFPDATRLPQIMDAAREIPAEQQEMVVPKIEEAYVRTMEEKPTGRKLEQYSQDFPELGRLNELAQSAANQPATLSQVQPTLERVIIHRVKTADQAEEIKAILPALEIASKGRSSTIANVEKAVEQKNPALSKVILPKLQELAEKNAAAERNRDEVERQKRLAAEKAREDSVNQVKAAQEAAKKEEETRLREEQEKSKAQKEADLAESSRLAKVAAQAEERKKALNAEKNEPTTTVDNNLLQPAMVYIKGGTFLMGDDKSENNDEKPAHSVTVSDFYLAKTEVTQAQWRAVMGSDPPELNFKGCDQCPVESVSWDDVQEFIKKLNAKTGKKYRLPTEAEWEYAARGGGKQTYTYAGSNTVDEVAWYDSNAGSKTHPVSLKKANGLGLYDMSGNVREWCQDRYADDYYAKSPSSNPPGPTTGSLRVFRGGSWLDRPAYVRVAYRLSYAPDDRDDFIGFRLARQQ